VRRECCAVLLMLWSAVCLTACCKGTTTCVDGIQVDVTLDAPLDALGSSTATLCRNGECATGEIPPHMGIESAYTTLVGDQFTVAVEADDLGNGSSRVSFVYRESPEFDTEYVDGDTYSAALVSASGSDQFSGSGSAVYSTFDRGCGGMVCTTMELDL
jgi:hypothetical protein